MPNVGGKGGGRRRIWYEVACDYHGIKHGKESHRSVAMPPPNTKRERRQGCPQCNAANKGEHNA